MRIERINENSIRCTLTSFDLSVRNLNLRELAYGSEKAKKLFDEMMSKASSEVGFNVENTPIMIEAIPMSSDSIQLIISKVSDPEELDTRFSRFTQNPGAAKKGTESWIDKLASTLLEGSNGLLEQIRNLDKAQNTEKPAEAQAATPASPAETPEIDFRAFEFTDLDMVIKACRSACGFTGESTLYKNETNGHYCLVLRCSESPAENFSRACNIIAEYGRMIKTVQNSLSYYREHYSIISDGKAVQKLSQI